MLKEGSDVGVAWNLERNTDFQVEVYQLLANRFFLFKHFCVQSFIKDLYMYNYCIIIRRSINNIEIKFTVLYFSNNMQWFHDELLRIIMPKFISAIPSPTAMYLPSLLRNIFSKIVHAIHLWDYFNLI